MVFGRHQPPELTRLGEIVAVEFPFVVIVDGSVHLQRRFFQVRVVLPFAVAVRLVGDRRSVIAVRAHLPVAVVVVERTAGFIHGNQVVVHAQPVALCVAVGKQPSLKHLVGRKYEIEQLMSGEKVHKEINENITFQYLDGDENSLWSLLLSVGYIKAENVVHKVDTIECDVSVTNKEVMAMFRTEILGMFRNGFSVYNRFVKALLEHNIEDMNDYLSEIACTSMSYFDVGNEKEARTPENFYHGLILGLIVTLRDRYRIVSNRESGRGRYDIAMYPLEKNQDAFLMEFKVWDKKKEKNLEETVESAFRQIEEKKYDAELIKRGVKKENIHHYGFAFEGKKVLIG